MTALSGSYYCDRCQAGYVRRLAKFQNYLCLCGGRLTRSANDESCKVRQLRAELAAAQVEIRALRAAVQWAGTHAQRALIRGPNECIAVCQQLAASDDLLAEMRRKSA